mmetsp:Transcript_20315/g.61217  ORF Transcript_20315/g.61217 Transcript_20315/m.61217 type:complete len:242 (-) Transcript_20315:1767-2492(-)
MQFISKVSLQGCEFQAKLGSSATHAPKQLCDRSAAWPLHEPVPRNHLEDFVQENDRGRQAHDGLPVHPAQCADTEQRRRPWDIKNEEVQQHGHADGPEQPQVAPGRELHQARVLGQRVEGIEHLHHHQNCHGNGPWPPIQEDVAVVALLPSFAALECRELSIGNLWTRRGVQEEPDEAGGGGKAHVQPHQEVPHHQPPRHDGVRRLSRLACHDARLRGVEAQCSGGQPVGHQVHPQQLHRV